MQFPSLPDDQTEFICPACYAPRNKFEHLDKAQIKEHLNSITTQALSQLHVAVTYSGTGYYARGGDVERKNVIHLFKRCQREGFSCIEDRFNRDETFRYNQSKAQYQGKARTLEVIQEMDRMVRSSNAKVVGGAGADAPESHLHWSERDYQHAAEPKARDMSLPEREHQTRQLNDMTTKNLIRAHEFLNRPRIATDAQCFHCNQLLSSSKLDKDSQKQCSKCGSFIRSNHRYARCLSCNIDICYNCVRGEHLHQQAKSQQFISSILFPNVKEQFHSPRSRKPLLLLPLLPRIGKPLHNHHHHHHRVLLQLSNQF